MYVVQLSRERTVPRSCNQYRVKLSICHVSISTHIAYNPYFDPTCDPAGWILRKSGCCAAYHPKTIEILLPQTHGQSCRLNPRVRPTDLPCWYQILLSCNEECVLFIIQEKGQYPDNATKTVWNFPFAMLALPHAFNPYFNPSVISILGNPASWILQWRVVELYIWGQAHWFAMLVSSSFILQWRMCDVHHSGERTVWN